MANCVVSAHPLTTKEQWLTPVLFRFLDDSHKSAMIYFLDKVSTLRNEANDPSSFENNNENFFPLIQQHKQESVPVLLKHGYVFFLTFYQII